MQRTSFTAIALMLMAFATSSFAEEREWVCANGIYKMNGEVIAYSADTVVLKRADGSLVAVELDELCENDVAFIKSKDSKDEPKKSADEMQTWTGADGLKVRGRVVKYGKKQLKISRQRG
ncbi:MAG: SHD1 domain-containing protein, partial [Planctomycetota bacterium]